MEVECSMCNQMIELDRAKIVKRYQGRRQLVIVDGRAHEVQVGPKIAKLERINGKLPIVDNTDPEPDDEIQQDEAA